MPGEASDQTSDDQARAAGLSLGRTVVGRDLTAEEADALTAIFAAVAQALKHGFIRRLADQVVAERTDESVEEFFGDVITPD